MCAAAVEAGSCLSSAGQRSAAQLSHLVRHRICLVLRQWREVKVRWRHLTLRCGLHVNRDETDRAGLKNGSRHRGRGGKGPWRESLGLRKHRQGDGGEPKERTTSPPSIWVSFKLSYFASRCFSFSHLTLSHLLALLSCWLLARLSVPPSRSVMEWWLEERRSDEAVEAWSKRKRSPLSFGIFHRNHISVGLIHRRLEKLQTVYDYFCCVL